MGFIIGLILGGCFGFLLAGICASAKEADQIAEIYRQQNKWEAEKVNMDHYDEFVKTTLPAKQDNNERTFNGQYRNI